MHALAELAQVANLCPHGTLRNMVTSSACKTKVLASEASKGERLYRQSCYVFGAEPSCRRSIIAWAYLWHAVKWY